METRPDPQNNVPVERHHMGTEKRVQEWQAILLPAVLFGEPIQGDASVSTGTLEKPL